MLKSSSATEKIAFTFVSEVWDFVGFLLSSFLLSFVSEETRSERSIVIRGYSDHAANERTFLAWLRTGIAVIAFGFVCLAYYRQRQDSLDETDRTRFLASLGLFTSGVFITLLAAQMIATLMLDPCMT